MSTLLNHREDAFVIGLAGRDQVIENAGELVGRGSDGGRCAEPGPHASEILAKMGVAAME